MEQASLTWGGVAEDPLLLGRQAPPANAVMGLAHAAKSCVHGTGLARSWTLLESGT